MAEFQIKNYHLYTKKLKKGCHLNFVLLADLHNKVYGAGNEKLIHAVKKCRPDAILIAGDMLIGHTKISFQPAESCVLALQQIAPVFYGNGNHETRMRVQTRIYGTRYEEYMKSLRDAGVQVLENKNTFFEKDGCRVRIHGFELGMEYYPKWRQPPLSLEQLEAALGSCDGEEFQILLAHNPVYFDQYAAWGADLTLSGHLHGGIIRLPLIGGVITPQVQLFPQYDKGLFQKDGKYLIVSPGLGTHTVNIRIGNPAELEFIELEGEA